VKTLKTKNYFSRSHLGIFLIIFAVIGAIILIKSLAAPNPNLPGDLNNDNVVNVTDMSILLSNYGTTNSSADINGDGTVNVLDLSILLSHYGQTYSGGGTGSWPLYGVSPGYAIQNRTSTMQDWEMSQDTAVGGKILRIDYNNSTTGDTVITKAIAHGLEPEIILGGTHTYSSSETASGFASNYCTAGPTKWKGKVRFYEVMNEPDLNGWTADTYVPFLKACYQAVKAADPNAIVFHGGMWDKNSATTFLIDWVAREYALGAKSFFDVFNFHCYGDSQINASWDIWDMVYGSNGAGFYDSYNVRSVMNSNGDSVKPIVCTEGGDKVPNVSETTQATEVQHALQSVDGIGTGYRRTKFMLIYDMLDTVPGFGMMYADSTGTIVAPDGTHWTKRPSWTSYYNSTH